MDQDSDYSLESRALPVEVMYVEIQQPLSSLVTFAVLRTEPIGRKAVSEEVRKFRPIIEYEMINAQES